MEEERGKLWRWLVGEERKRKSLRDDFLQKMTTIRLSPVCNFYMWWGGGGGAELTWNLHTTTTNYQAFSTTTTTTTASIIWRTRTLWASSLENWKRWVPRYQRRIWSWGPKACESMEIKRGQERGTPVEFMSTSKASHLSDMLQKTICSRRQGEGSAESLNNGNVLDH